jgi:hypothetical protein
MIIIANIVINMSFSSGIIEWDGNGWIKVNLNYNGFYMTNYEDSNWEALARQLNDNHKVIRKTCYVMLYIYIYL